MARELPPRLDRLPVFAARRPEGRGDEVGGKTKDAPVVGSVVASARACVLGEGMPGLLAPLERTDGDGSGDERTTDGMTAETERP